MATQYAKNVQKNVKIVAIKWIKKKEEGIIVIKRS